MALGNVLRDRFDWREAEEAYQQALSIDSDHAEAHHQYGEMLIATGRIADAVRSLGRAAALDPAPVRFNVLGFALASDDREEEAIQSLERGILLDPEINLINLRGNLGLVHYDAQRYDMAYNVWATVPGASEDMDPTWDDFVRLMEGGDLEAFSDEFKESLAPGDMVHLGELDRAANRLSNPPGANWVGNVYRVWHPVFDSIRDLPAMQEYLAERGLADVTAQRTPPGERQTPAVLRNDEAGS